MGRTHSSEKQQQAEEEEEQSEEEKDREEREGISFYTASLGLAARLADHPDRLVAAAAVTTTVPAVIVMSTTYRTAKCREDPTETAVPASIPAILR